MKGQHMEADLKAYLDGKFAEIERRITEIQAAQIAAPRITPPAAPDYSDFPDGLRRTAVMKDGQPVFLALRAPVNQAWRPSTNAWNLGGQGTDNGQTAIEPSNAKGDQPARSANGWPLVYIDGRMDPLIAYGDEWYPTEQHLFDALKADEARRRAQDQPSDYQSIGPIPSGESDDVMIAIGVAKRIPGCDRADMELLAGTRTETANAIQRIADLMVQVGATDPARLSLPLGGYVGPWADTINAWVAAHRTDGR
jgi:hypothetical protein